MDSCKLMILAATMLALTTSANAADLGGNCCADLEERIAELEATTARKGNRKVSLTISGQINKAVLYYDFDDVSNQAVVENSADESRLAFSGRGVIRPFWEAGFRIELGQGVTGLDLDASLNLSVETQNDLYARQSLVFVSTPAGKVSVGLVEMATHNLVSGSVGATNAATKRLTLQPVGHAFGTNLEPFNGERKNAVRYDSPVWFGVLGSGAWSSDDDGYDVALRYTGELAGFRLLAGAGYEVDKSDDLVVGVETRTVTLNAGVAHAATGLFVQGSAGQLDVDLVGVDKTEAYHVQAGIERRPFSDLGPTTVWGEYADWTDLDLSLYGIGANQNLTEGLDVYVVGRHYEFGDVDGLSVLGGTKIGF